jgi:hypothetical protein
VANPSRTTTHPPRPRRARRRPGPPTRVRRVRPARPGGCAARCRGARGPAVTRRRPRRVCGPAAPCRPRRPGRPSPPGRRLTARRPGSPRRSRTSSSLTSPAHHSGAVWPNGYRHSTLKSPWPTAASLASSESWPHIPAPSSASLPRSPDSYRPPQAITRTDYAVPPPWRTCAAPHPFPSAPDAPTATDSTAEATQPRGHTPSRRAEVTESRVTNSVTSTPAATRTSVSRPITRSHCPQWRGGGRQATGPSRTSHAVRRS